MSRCDLPYLSENCFSFFQLFCITVWDLDSDACSILSILWPDAYYCVQLFDSIGFELYAKDRGYSVGFFNGPLVHGSALQDLQEVKGPHGLGIYCTLDLQKAQETGKTVLLAEFLAAKEVVFPC